MPEPGPGDPRVVCGCPIRGGRPDRTAPPLIGGSVTALAPSGSHAATLLAAAASTSQPQTPGLAGRHGPIRHLDFVAPVAIGVRGPKRVDAGFRGVPRVPEPVGAPRVIFKVF
ncbi:hypothetical protein NDU88_007322 [Pleurodeles waltl]|uniref:Uncharacterized protein n=1 Tax=Pleurodeles waltl TaxID=8319 RepID=A0AAV7VTH2_PLEWA|nr:hypothetical protein NDU88_007322 [Pleurodeles waltl]